MTMRIRAAALGLLAATIGAPALAQDEPASRPADRPIGGSAVSIADYPWQVALVRDRQDFFNGQFCGATVIAPTWVLTAAHCVYDRKTGFLKDPTSFAVYWGSASLEGGGYLADVARIVPHAGYTTTAGGDDIALIELLAPIDATPVRLATPESAASLESVSLRGMVTGWGEYEPDYDAQAEAAGLTDDGSGQGYYPTELQGAEVPLVDLDSCEVGLKAYNPDLDTGVICAGKQLSGVDACNGDSGGPLHVRDEDGVWTQVGIVSWGDPCSAGGNFNVYTRVSSYSRWIEDAMAGRAEAADPFPADIMGTVPGRVPFSLAAGFALHAEAAEAGGDRPASDRAEGCTGFIAAQPDFSLHFAAGGAPLSIAVAGAAAETDTTLVVIAPDGQILCDDDTEGLNPAVTLPAPPSGEYRIWVGTIAPVIADDDPLTPGFPPATLYVSESGPQFAG